MTDDLDYHQLHWLLGKPTATGIIKAGAADFQVREELGFEPDGEGEPPDRAVVLPASAREKRS